MESHNFSLSWKKISEKHEMHRSICSTIIYIINERKLVNAIKNIDLEIKIEVEIKKSRCASHFVEVLIDRKL